MKTLLTAMVVSLSAISVQATEMDFDALQEQMEFLIDRNDTLNSEVISLTKTNGKLNTKVDDLQDTVSEQEDTIGSLQGDLQSAYNSMDALETAAYTEKMNAKMAKEKHNEALAEIAALKAQLAAKDEEIEELEWDLHIESSAAAILRDKIDAVLDMETFDNTAASTPSSSSSISTTDETDDSAWIQKLTANYDGNQYSYTLQFEVNGDEAAADVDQRTEVIVQNSYHVGFIHAWEDAYQRGWEDAIDALDIPEQFQ